ncbi:MAG: hypothetical protein N3A62_03630, partial [Thermodesulfovibrionales bacterium]|nr:hypothetical protein [Thermodesulfovibrionales bacterium]
MWHNRNLRIGLLIFFILANIQPVFAEDVEVLKIIDFSTRPNLVTPGGSSIIEGKYIILTKDSPIKIIEERELHYLDTNTNKWMLLGSVSNEVLSVNGMRAASGKFDWPKEMQEGTYRITLTIKHRNLISSSSDIVVVKKDDASEKTGHTSLSNKEDPCKIMYETFNEECIDVGNVSRVTMQNLYYYSEYIDDAKYTTLCETKKPISYNNFNKLVCKGKTSSSKKDSNKIISSEKILTRHGDINLVTKKKEDINEIYLSIKNLSILMDGEFGGFEEVMYKLNSQDIFIYSFSIGNMYEGKQLVIVTKDGIYISENIGYFSNVVVKRDKIIFEREFKKDKKIITFYDGKNIYTNYDEAKGKWGKVQIKIKRII